MFCKLQTQTIHYHKNGNTNTNQMEAVFDYGVATGNSATGTGAFKIKKTRHGPKFYYFK